MKRNRLKYAGRGQIVCEADGRLVSPRDVVTWFNDLCDVADEMHATLTTILDAMTNGLELNGESRKGKRKGREE